MNATCASPWGGTCTVSNRDVTICMESVSDETFTFTGYGWLLLMVTGIFAVSLTTFTLSVGVIATPLISRAASWFAPSAIVLLEGLSPPNACRAMMVWAFVSCLLQVLTSDSSFPFGLTRIDVLKRLMLLDEFASALRVCWTSLRMLSVRPSVWGRSVDMLAASSEMSASFNVARSVRFSHGDCSMSLISASTTLGSESSFRQTSRLRSA